MNEKSQITHWFILSVDFSSITFINLRVIYSIYEYDPLLDSSNMTMDDWIQIAKDIEDAYELFDGFVILHGTDTLAYTASALSFMLENLGKCPKQP